MLAKLITILGFGSALLVIEALVMLKLYESLKDVKEHRTKEEEREIALAVMLCAVIVTLGIMWGMTYSTFDAYSIYG